MYFIRQEELFSFEQLMELQPAHKYSAILNHLPVESILHKIGKKTTRGRPEDLNYRAMIYSLVIGKIERMVFVKDIVKRLKSNEEFRQLCRFTGSDRIPSEAMYSRLVTKLQRCNVLSDVQDQLVSQALSEGFLSGSVLAVDGTHVEAWELSKAKKEARRKAKAALFPGDSTNNLAAVTGTNMPEQIQYPPSTAYVPPSPVPRANPKHKYTRGRPTNAVKEARRKEREDYESSLPVFEQQVAGMLPLSYEALHGLIPQQPSSSAKRNSKGQQMYWFGFKAHLLVDTQSQYIVSGLQSSAHVSEHRMAIMLLKRLQAKLPTLQVQHVLGDKGYDSPAVFQQVRAMGAYPLIDTQPHPERLPEGIDDHFRPVCQKGFSYRYDSFDTKYQTLKFTRPKECEACSLRDQGCKRVHKIRIDQDLRRYTFPARGSDRYVQLFKQRTAVERVFAYMKLYFGMGQTRYRGTRARVNFDLSCLTYTLCKFALDKLNQSLQATEKAG